MTSTPRPSIEGPLSGALVNTRWGPDRIAGFSPIPAMSPVSYASGSRFHELIGSPMLSFYDWYADLPNVGAREPKRGWEPSR